MRLLCAFLFLNSLVATEIYIKTEEGIFLKIEANNDMSIKDLSDLVDLYQSTPQNEREELFEGLLSDLVDLYQSTPQNEREELFEGLLSEASLMRNYHQQLTSKEKADIVYIVTTLSDVSTIKLLNYKADLQKAGDRIIHIHPLNFLYAVFGDPVLKVKIQNIKSKSLVWRDFIGGFSNSMAEEAGKGNIPREYIDDFAKKVDIDPKLLYTPIDQKRFDEVVITLIKHVKRDGNPDRYDF